MRFPEFPDFECEDDSCAATMVVPAFGNASVELCVLLESGATAPSRRQLEVVESLTLLAGTELAESIADNARRYCRQVDSVVNLAGEGVEIDMEHIEKHFQVVEVTIPVLMDCDTDFAFLGANCDWEEEHGMEIMLMDGRVGYCGDYVTMFDGPDWRQVVSAPTQESRENVLHELLAAIQRDGAV